MENQSTISSDLIRGHIDTIILHTLLESDKFAQQISDAIEKKSENEYKINQATLYSSLKRLEASQFVSSYWHDYEDGRRKYFKITESGKNFVENSLSSWAYSRAVIDKLMNLSPTPIYKNSETNYTAVEPAKAQVVADESEKTAIQEDKVSVSDKIEEKNKNISVEEEHERNFRNILNGLMQVSQTVDETKNDELKPLISDEIQEKESDVLKFSDTIDETDYNANKVNYNGKIDYGDLTLKAEREGYVIRISAKDSAKPKGKLLINKLNFATSAFILLVVLVELGILLLTNGAIFKTVPVIVLSAVSLLPVIIFGAIYFSDKGKLSAGKITADSILTSAIVAFNLILINFAVDFLLDVDFSDITLLMTVLIIPVLYYVDIVLFFWFRYLLSIRKSFAIK